MGEPLPQQTLADLYDAHGAQLYRYAALILGDRAAAEDAVQEVFARMLSLDSARGDFICLPCDVGSQHLYLKIYEA